MVLEVTVATKSFGPDELYTDLYFAANETEKIGIVGRNGVGKTTLLDIIAGTDTDFDGEVFIKKSVNLISSRQEHHGQGDLLVLDYILGDLPEYKKLKHQLDTLPATIGENAHHMNLYSDALERFGALGYYEVENTIEKIISIYQLPEDVLKRTIGTLSGGQLRLIELVKVQVADAGVILIDEPTNHMDYVAKADFIKWMNASESAVIVITHDRDVLSNVDRIIEIRDGAAHSYPGNYEKYLSMNSDQMTGAVNEYEIVKARIRNLENDVIRFQRLKEKSRTPGTIKRFKGQEQKARAELAKLKEMDKPSFWIDQDSTKDLGTKMQAAYEEHKAKTITLRMPRHDGVSKNILRVDKVSLGYEKALFEPVSFELFTGSKVQLKGRNGVGKTTLVSAIINTLNSHDLTSKVFDGNIDVSNHVPFGEYSQNFEEQYLEMTLNDAVEHTYLSRGLDITNQRIKTLLKDFLFNPIADGNKKMKVLSGGQKARFQLIAMLANNPQVLFLDEPTNHLDLPSIEELELTLKKFQGAIIYVSHDTHFSDAIGGDVVELK